MYDNPKWCPEDEHDWQERDGLHVCTKCEAVGVPEERL